MQCLVRMKFKLEPEIAHLWQGHENGNMTMLDDVKLRGLNNVLPAYMHTTSF